MNLKEIKKDIYDVDAWIDEGIGAVGTQQRAKAMEEAWEEYNAQILLDARKAARLTQEEVARRTGTSKGYISRVERGLTIPTVATLYRLVGAMGMKIEIVPR